MPGGKEEISEFLQAKFLPIVEDLKPKKVIATIIVTCKMWISTNCNINMKATEMAWILRDKERVAVSALDGPSRYNYFVKKAADENCIWSLWQNGWVLAEDGGGRLAVPVWPHAQFAEICARGVWEGHEPRQIEMVAWLDRWLPGIQRDGRLIAIFPTADDKGIIVEPERLASDLSDELRNYE